MKAMLINNYGENSVFEDAEIEKPEIRAPQPARAAPAPPAAPSAPVPGVAFDAAAGTITLSGPGVTRALADDLGRWLARRQPGKAD